MLINIYNIYKKDNQPHQFFRTIYIETSAQQSLNVCIPLCSANIECKWGIN
jgi:hypothetical protein